MVRLRQFRIGCSCLYIYFQGITNDIHEIILEELILAFAFFVCEKNKLFLLRSRLNKYWEIESVNENRYCGRIQIKPLQQQIVSIEKIYRAQKTDVSEKLNTGLF